MATAKDKKTPILITPALKAAYAWVAKPDTKFDEEGKYKITLLSPKTKGKVKDAFIEQMKGFSPDLVKDGDKNDKEEFHGFWMTTFKSSYKPDLRDAKKNPLPSNVTVMSGDIVRVAFKASEYKPGKFTLYLQAIQLIEKINMGGKGGDAFDETEGYTADTGPGKPDSKSDDVDF